MSDKELPIYFEKTLLTKSVVKSVSTTRYAVENGKTDKDKVAMTTEAAMSFIKKGLSNWVIDSQSPKGMETNQREDIQPPKVEVEATWLNATQALESNVDVVAGSSGNTFGKMGALLVPDNFRIPQVVATEDNVKYYGLQLIKNGENLSVRSPEVDIVMMEYDYTSIYRDEFLLKEHGGGGIFVETHEFPHIHIPLNANCGGYIVIGKQIGDNLYHFTAFQIPFGCALYTPSNTIHGDGTLVGQYGITVADPSMIQADTVLIYNKNTEKMAHHVVPEWD